MAKTGAARVFFDIVGRFQSTRLLADSRAAMTVQQAIIVDAIGAVQDAMGDMATYVTGALNTVVESFFTYEEELVRVRKFYNAAEEDVLRFADASRELGLQFAFTGAEALTAAARTSQLKGVLKSQEAVIEATRQGLLMAQIGEMETELGMNRFIALAQQTQFLYGGLTKAQYESLDAEKQANIVRESSIHALNQLNTIENSSVATMEDITFVLNQFASQADIAGESIGDMAAMSALLLETGEEVSRAGTGLRMIYQRLGNANNEATKAIAELIPELDSQGVAQLKLSEVIEKIAPAYADMTAEEKRALAVNIAGSRHYVKFLKIMENQTRLTELRTAAFRAEYTAIDEFSQKSKSAVFQAQQMEAALENMRAKIGEDLTDAYMTAYEAEEVFLKGVGFALKSEAIQDLVGGVVAIGNVYQQTVEPVSNIAFQISNLVIAMRTLNAVTAKGQAQIKERVRTYAEANLMNKLQMGFEKDLLSIGNHRLALMNRQQQSRIMLASIERRAASANLAETKQEITLKQNQLLVDKKALNFLQGKKGKEAAASRKLLTKSINENQMALISLNLKRKEELKIVRLAVIEQQRESTIMKITTAQKAQRILMEKRSIEQRYKQVESQKSFTELLQTESSLMQQEVVLYTALDAKIKQNLISRNADLALRQREEQDILAALYLQQAEALAKGKSTEAIKERIQKAQQNIQTMAEERIQIQALIGADKALEVETKKASVATGTLTARMKEAAIAMQESGAMAKSFNIAIMGTSMILPMVVDEQDQMTAMMYGMALMISASAIPALVSLNATLMTTLAVSGLVAAPITLLIAALGGLAAWLGYEYVFKPLVGDTFKSDLADIKALNAELDTTASILSDLSGTAGGTEVLSGLGVTFNDLKQSAELTGNTLSGLEDKQKSLEESILQAQQRGDTELEAGFRATLSLTEDAITKVKAISQAQKIIASDAAQSFDDVGKIVGEMQKQTLSVEASGFATGKANDLVNYYTITYEDIDGIIQTHTEMSKKGMEDWIALHNNYNETDLDFTKDYYRSLLDVQIDGNNAMIEEERRFYNHLTQEQEGFANAREELFFGERANFTGAIYKQVVQGGVESLLHKTEIVQTNVFNGYNTEQMVDRVTKGVLDELRAQGVVSI